MNRIATTTIVVCLLVASSLFADIEGAWTAQLDPKKDRVFLNATKGPFGNWGMTHDLTDVTGLSRAQMESPTTTPVQFQMRREAGTVTFEGTFRRGVGAGQLTFTPNRSYFAQIRAQGVSVEFEKPEEEELFKLAMLDLSVAYVREMHAIYPDADLRELSRLRAVDVTPAWLAEMRSAGVAIQSARDAKKLAALGVNAKFVRELADAGYTNLSIRDLTRLAAVGVDGKFIRDMQQYREK